MNINRRDFLGSTAFAAASASSFSSADESSSSEHRNILLRSSWQTVNIGDIAHTPGMLTLIEKYLPDVTVTLWPGRIDRGVDKILQKRFPKLKVATTDAEKQAAMEQCDFMLHGSGPALVGVKATRMAMEMGKPYGFGGITLNDHEIKTKRELLENAEFIFFRDTDSMKAVQNAGIEGPKMAFGPDATFAIDIKNDDAAKRLIKRFDLRSGKFLCAIPRLRYTPYWEIHPEWTKPNPEKIAVNKEYVEVDAAKVRAAVTGWVRQTGMKAFLVPEMTYELPLLTTLLFDHLPSDVQEKTAVMDRYWITDEAVALYGHAAAMVSCEQHSPIMCISQGVPAILLRQPTDTRKGQMWRDVGLDRWIFEIDEASEQQIADRVVEVGRAFSAAREYASKAKRYADERMKQMIEAI